MEKIVRIDRTYNGKSRMNEKIYNLILNMMLEYLLNNPFEVYNEDDVNRNVIKEVEDEK